MMRAGQLNVRGRIESPVEASDGMGGADVTWTLIGDAWMNIVPGSGREFWAIQHTQPLATHVITIRYRTDVTAGMRIIANGKAYRIVAPPADVDHMHEQLRLTCEQYAEGAP